MLLSSPICRSRRMGSVISRIRFSSPFHPERYGTSAWVPFSRGRHKARDKLLRVFTLNRLSALRLHELEGIDSLVKARDNHLRVRAIGISQASTSRWTDIHVSIMYNDWIHRRIEIRIKVHSTLCSHLNTRGMERLERYRDICAELRSSTNVYLYVYFVYMLILSIGYH